jgi:hypothetical protein
MAVSRRVFTSLTHDSHLNDSQNRIKWGIVQRVIDEGYTPHIFFPAVPSDFSATVHREMPWSAERVEEAIRGSVGALMIGFPRWHVGEGSLASEYTHYEAGVARTIGRPMLMIQETGAPLRGAYDPGSSGVCVVPSEAEETWLESAAFRQSIEMWLARIRERHDVFLGYSSQAEGVAKNLKRMMVAHGATVLDWQDFGPGTVLEQIDRASNLCTAGVFLFTRDDVLDAEQGKAAPRDNVVFEAGYFVNAKRQRRVLIVLEAGAKLPADLGGAIFAPLDDRSNIEALEGQLERFLQEL